MSFIDAKARNSAYIFDHAEGPNPDPLIRFIAETPVHYNYKNLHQGPRTSGSLVNSQKYISFQHVSLLVLLHRLGLRGIPKYAR